MKDRRRNGGKENERSRKGIQRNKEGGIEGSCPLHWKTLHILSFLAIYLALFYLVFLKICAAICRGHAASGTRNFHSLSAAGDQ
jgi:hypothetical protein